MRSRLLVYAAILVPMQFMLTKSVFTRAAFRLQGASKCQGKEVLIKKKKYNNCHGEAGTQKNAAISIYIATTVSTAQNNGIWERVLLSPEDRLIQCAGKHFKLRKRYCEL